MILKIIKKIGGTRRDGSIFNVLQSLIFKIEIPELAIKIPPSKEISVSSSGVKNGSSQVAQRKIEPCQQNNTMAANAMPIPYVDASTVEVTKSNVALVNK